MRTDANMQPVMRFAAWSTLIAAGLLALAIMGCSRNKVQRLGLHDPRLPLEARRWLADAEDEVVISQARYNDARTRQLHLQTYMQGLMQQINPRWGAPKTKAAAQGKHAAQAFQQYTDQRLQMARMDVEACLTELQLAKLRLTLARAEVAIRNDVAVYDTEPMLRQIEVLREQIGTKRRAIEEQRVTVEKSFDALWQKYAAYVKKGGITNALWLTQ